LNHREYIEDFLSAHADGELAGAELREAEEHVASCTQCAARLEQERALKGLVRKHGHAELPSATHAKLMAVLAEEAARGEGALQQTSDTQRRTSREGGLRALRRPAVWIPIAMAACLALVFIATRQMGFLGGDSVRIVYHQGGVRDFDIATAYFAKLDRDFHPNVPSDSYGDIAGAYVDAHMPGYLWNFNGSGLRLVGGRLDKLPDGRMGTFTLYRGGGNSLMCIRFKRSIDRLPPGSVHAMAGHLFYSYYGYSICYSYSPIGDFVCLLITRQPVNQLLENVEYASE
jgi:putative zinc finger protein